MEKLGQGPSSQQIHTASNQGVSVTACVQQYVLWQQLLVLGICTSTGQYFTLDMAHCCLLPGDAVLTGALYVIPAV